jgi:hypothetical protein
MSSVGPLQNIETTNFGRSGIIVLCSSSFRLLFINTAAAALLRVLDPLAEKSLTWALPSCLTPIMKDLVTSIPASPFGVDERSNQVSHIIRACPHSVHVCAFGIGRVPPNEGRIVLVLSQSSQSFSSV